MAQSRENQQRLADSSCVTAVRQAHPLKFLFLVFEMFRSGSFGPMISKAEVLSLCELRRDRFYRFR